MALARFIKNISGGTIRFKSVPLSNNAFFEIPLFLYSKFASDEEVVERINNDEILLSFDGVNELSKANSLLAIKTFAEAEQIYFSHDGTEFSDLIKDVGSALINVREDLNTQKAALYEIYKTSAQNITNTRATVIFNQERTNNDPTLLTISNGEITFLRDAELLVSVKVSADVNSNTRTSTALYPQSADGGAFSDIPGTDAYGYHRQSSNGEGDLKSTFTMTVSAGMQLRFQTQVINGDSSFPFITNGTNLVISETAAKGARGSAGVSGFEYLFGAGVPSNSLGEDGDIYTDTISGDQYQKVGGSWTFRLNIKGPQGPAGAEWLLWAEENGNLNNNSTQWSFGNGATGDIGIVMPKAGIISGMTLSSTSTGSGTANVELLINGSSVNRSVTLGSGESEAINVAGFTDIAFSAGDRIGFRTVIGGSRAQSRVAALINYN